MHSLNFHVVVTDTAIANNDLECLSWSNGVGAFGVTAATAVIGRECAKITARSDATATGAVDLELH